MALSLKLKPKDEMQKSQRPHIIAMVQNDTKLVIVKVSVYPKCQPRVVAASQSHVS